MQKLLKPLLAIKTVTGYSIFTIVVVTLFSTWALFEATKSEVVVAADGEVQTVKTRIETVGELLDELGIDVGENDELSHAINEKIKDGMEINFETAQKITLIIDGEKEEFLTTAETVGQFFKEEEITFSEHDEVSRSSIEIINGNMEIVINTAFPVEVIDGSEDAEEFWTTGGTVEDFLEENEISLGKLDKVEPGLDEELEKDMEIIITHVEKKKKDVKENLAHGVEEREDSSLEKGKSYTISEGTNGKILKTYEITYENGKEVDREVIGEEILQESKNKIVAVGTKAAEKPVQKEAPASSGKTFTMEATAYGPDCAGCSGISATGMNLKGSPTPKVISVDPSVIPLGSRVWVEGYGEAIAADTGGAIKGNRIDVLVQSEAYAASNWGRRTVTVKVLD